MKICIVESTGKRTAKEETSVVHVKNSLILAKELGAETVMQESEAVKLEEKYDAIVFSYASPYMPYKTYADMVLKHNSQAQLFWLVNDHDIEDNIALRTILLAENGRRKYHMICNNPRQGYRQWILKKKMNGLTLNDWIDCWLTVNLNTLIFGEHEIKERGMFNEHNENTIYWGTYRKHRLPYFLKYSDPSIVFSTSTKNQKKLIENGCNYTYCERINWNDKMPFRSSLYLEDVHTHDNYAFLANRFYEALNCGMATFFDVSTKNTVLKCGEEMGDCVVDGVEDLNSKSRNWRDVYNKQRGLSCKILDEKSDVISKIRKFISDPK